MKTETLEAEQDAYDRGYDDGKRGELSNPTYTEQHLIETYQRGHHKGKQHRDVDRACRMTG